MVNMALPIRLYDDYTENVCINVSANLNLHH